MCPIHWCLRNIIPYCFFPHEREYRLFKTKSNFYPFLSHSHIALHIREIWGYRWWISILCIQYTWILYELLWKRFLVDHEWVSSNDANYHNIHYSKYLFFQCILYHMDGSSFTLFESFLREYGKFGDSCWTKVNIFHDDGQYNFKFINDIHILH